MKRRILVGFIIGVFLFGMAGMAYAVTITFDAFVDEGDRGGEVLGNEWLCEGILFSTPDAELNLGISTGSSPNSLGANITPGGNDFSGGVSFEFIDNNYASELSFTVFKTPVQASAYDLLGNLLKTLSNVSDNTQIFDFSGNDVHRVDIAGSFYSIDDVTFTLNTQPVPEPATMILLGIGLVILAVIGRKKFLKK